MTSQDISARSLVFWSLSTAAPKPVRTATLVDRAEIFGLEATATRMALGRLVREGMVDALERGAYVLGPAAMAIHTKGRGWAQSEDRVRPWAGEWIVALTNHLGRTNRTVLQRRERALRLGGFACSIEGAWVRPDSLKRRLDAMVEDLHELGLDKGAIVFGGCKPTETVGMGLRSLWHRTEIESDYRRWIREMKASTQRAMMLSPRAAAREALLLGQSVIRAINFDPLLPDALIDIRLRRDLIAAMVAYDDLGRRLWKRIDARGTPTKNNVAETV